MSTTMTEILLALAGVFLVAYLMRRRARRRSGGTLQGTGAAAGGRAFLLCSRR